MVNTRTTFQQIAASWLAMKPWVRNWLFLLNGVFLAAFAFIGDPAGRWTLIAYVASGPLLAWCMVRQRGLTRLLGIAHLVPWVPLLGYLVLRLTSARVGPMVTFADTPSLATYLYVLTACIAICLAFDLWDVIRYIRGERYLLGSAEAVRLGASRPSPTTMPWEHKA